MKIIAHVFLLIAMVLSGCNNLDDAWQVEHAVSGDGQHIHSVTSPIFEVADIYRSMKGPASWHEFSLDSLSNDSLFWITGYRSKVTDHKDVEAPDAFMCHNNFYIPASWYWERRGMDARQDVFGAPARITMTPGQLALRFPKGFGIPVFGDERIVTDTQVLNLNDSAFGRKVRHRSNLYCEKGPLKPLIQQTVQILRPVGEHMHQAPVTSKKEAAPDAEHLGCHAVKTASKGSMRDVEEGDPVTGHWVIPPGRDSVVNDVTAMLNLPFSTTVHYIGVHVHPFCESLVLLDRTTDSVIFRATASTRYNENKISLEHIDHFSSEEGVMLHADHQYELISVTNNITENDQDMMAVMYLYLLDTERIDQ